MFEILIVVGTLIGIFVAFMGHPAFASRVLRKPHRSADHEDSHD